MVKSRYPYLIQQRRRWFVRMVVPPDVREVIGRSIFKVPTGHTDEHRAAAVAAGIIAKLQDQIRTARAAGKRLEQVTAEHLAERYQTERQTNPDKAEVTRITDVIGFVLRTNGGNWPEQVSRVQEAGYDIHAALRLAPGGETMAEAADRITGHATPLLSYLDKWKPHAGLKPRPLDQAISSIKQFEKAVAKPIEQIGEHDVQRWIESLINAEGESGLSSKTVNRKLGEIRNYWTWMQQHRLVPKSHNPFDGHRVRDPANRRKSKDEERQRFRPEDVVRCWIAAEQNNDEPLAAAIKIAAYSGARIEGVAQLQKSDIREDPDTKIRFMRMTDKTAAGDRFVPVHPRITGLIKQLTKQANEKDYLIHSTAENKYGERSQPIGKRFGRLKTDLGFDHRYVFHSIRKTVTHLLETAECPPGIAKDIVGHAKTDLTFGIYSGETRMDHRLRWLKKAIVYPATASKTGSKGQSGSAS
jgi:integrase